MEGHIPQANEASGHRWSDAQNTHVPDDIVSLPVTAPDGGLVTTLSDFQKWARIYAGADQSILSPASIEMITSQHISTDSNGGPMRSYGYGLATGDQLVGHSGSIVGFRSQFVFMPEQALLIAIFSNSTSTSPRQMAQGLLSILAAAEP